MTYYRPDLAYAGFFSSNGDITTTSTDQNIPFVDGASNPVKAGSIAIEFVTACNVSFDGSTNYHSFPAGRKINLDRAGFDSIQVQTIGSTLNFFGLHT